ncbi:MULTISPECIES: helix-turn-helix domain-containing protein [Methylorubrum]|uniref:Uncharacterized protein n=2 Tax=Methylorubrum TaxID=2282523 RepID=A0A514KKR5_9HYPH|nr:MULTISPECIES: helix-turn-helix domain-containing protein [Methylorubrum]KAB7787277.1 hypothetical protein F8B43_0713 [Methylorubrum populi]MBA8915406.1 putative transcriptional regulator [Methylorubrum thiocyanatum]QDI79765.1 helix-turn-helix domain-containing protein [Methylorubrum populi]GJE81333.1 hypothetical protein CJNNKLLH_2685 [Methylorubrum thiocyanatum]
MARITLEEALARSSTVDREKLATTSEAEIRNYMRDDGYDPDAPIEPGRVVYPPRAVREQFGLTQAAFAAWIGVPLATLRNWEQGRTSPDPSARALMRMMAREPEAARRALGSVTPDLRRSRGHRPES